MKRGRKQTATTLHRIYRGWSKRYSMYGFSAIYSLKLARPMNCFCVIIDSHSTICVMLFDIFLVKCCISSYLQIILETSVHLLCTLFYLYCLKLFINSNSTVYSMLLICSCNTCLISYSMFLLSVCLFVCHHSSFDTYCGGGSALLSVCLFVCHHSSFDTYYGGGSVH